MDRKHLVASAGMHWLGLSLLPTLSDEEKQAMDGSLTFDSENARTKNAVVTSMAWGLARDFLGDVACRIPASNLSVDNGTAFPHQICASVNAPATRAMAAAIPQQQALDLAKQTMDAILCHSPSWDRLLRQNGLPVLRYDAIDPNDTSDRTAANELNHRELVRVIKSITS